MCRNACFAFIACVFFACESGGGAEGGTSAPTTPKTPDQGGVVPNGGDQGNDTAPDTAPLPQDSTPLSDPKDDPLINAIWDRLDKHEVCADTQSVYGIVCGHATITPREEMLEWQKARCNEDTVGFIFLKIPDDPPDSNYNFSHTACLDATDPPLSLCKNDAAPCSGDPERGWVHLGTCASAGEQTASATSTRCLRKEDCGEGYCDTFQAEAIILIETCWNGKCQGEYGEYFFPPEA